MKKPRVIIIGQSSETTAWQELCQSWWETLVLQFADLPEVPKELVYLIEAAVQLNDNPRAAIAFSKATDTPLHDTRGALMWLIYIAYQVGNGLLILPPLLPEPLVEMYETDDEIMELTSNALIV